MTIRGEDDFDLVCLRSAISHYMLLDFAWAQQTSPNCNPDSPQHCDQAVQEICHSKGFKEGFGPLKTHLKANNNKFYGTIACSGLQLNPKAECTPSLNGSLNLASVFSNNMVLQRDKPVALWGSSAACNTITAQLGDNTFALGTSNKQGQWKLSLPPQTKNTKGQTLHITSGNQEASVQNVLIGEVWLCSGQSNMQWALQSSQFYQATIPKTNTPLVRLLQVERVRAGTPANSINAKWSVSSQATAAAFSGVCYHFGLNMKEHFSNQVPIGLINSSFGGTAAEEWTSRQSLQTLALQNSPRASDLYNAMIHPLAPYTLRGFLWYQGESNALRGASNARQYYELLQLTIGDWRSLWGDGSLPFYQVHLAGFAPGGDSNNQLWTTLRHQQWRLSQLPNIEMASAMDIGNRTDIHPKNKREVGRRLSLIAKNQVYNANVEYRGPEFKSYSKSGNSVTIEFTSLSALETSDGQAPRGFAATVAGQAVAVPAVIQNGKVVLNLSAVSRPTHITYGWAAYHPWNLQNGAKLPAIPFGFQLP